MLWVYDHVKYFILSLRRIDFGRLYLTYSKVDPRIATNFKFFDASNDQQNIIT